MKRDQSIVMFNVADRTMDIYKDFTPVAELLGIPRTTLQSRLDSGVQYNGKYFVGYGNNHKSNRGRK